MTRSLVESRLRTRWLARLYMFADGALRTRSISQG